MSPSDEPWDMETAASGRSSLSKTRDSDWEDIVRAVRKLPAMRRELGTEIAIAWAQIELSSIVDIVNLADPDSPEIALAKHRIHLYFTEGVLRVMMRDDYAGFNRRRKFLRAIQRWMLHPTFKAVFRSSLNDAGRRNYIPSIQNLESPKKP